MNESFLIFKPCLWQWAWRWRRGTWHCPWNQGFSWPFSLWVSSLESSRLQSSRRKRAMFLNSPLLPLIPFSEFLLFLLLLSMFFDYWSVCLAPWTCIITFDIVTLVLFSLLLFQFLHVLSSFLPVNFLNSCHKFIVRPWGVPHFF